MIADKRILIVLLAVIALLVAPNSFAQSSPDPGHPAEEVGGGTFNGNYGRFIFPNNITAENISMEYNCIGGTCRNTWPDSSIDSCGDVNGCTITAENTLCNDDYIMDGNGDCWAIETSSNCDIGEVCGGGHTHNYDNYNGWDLFINGVQEDTITTAASLGFNAGTGANLIWNSDDIDVTFDCSEVAGTHIGCSGEFMYVSTDFEEESHCTEHDGTGLSCASDVLSIDSQYQGAGARCNANQFLNGDGTCDTGYLDADGIDSVDDAVSDCTEARACESDPQVDSISSGSWCTADGAGNAIDCTTSAPILACNECANTYVEQTGEATGAMTSNLNIDANTLVIDITNNRVGIGITTPLSTLSVGTSGLTTYEFAAGYDVDNYAYAAGDGYGFQGISDDQGINAVSSSYSLYGTGGKYGAFASGAGGAYAMIASTSAGTAALGATDTDGLALFSQGTMEIERGGLCIDDGTGCSSSTAGDGDVIIRDGGLCVGTSSCVIPSDGRMRAAGKIYSDTNSLAGYINYGIKGPSYSSQIYYSSLRYTFYDETGTAAIQVSGCTGCDIAEHASVSSDEPIESGDILIIHKDENTDLTKSTEPYSNSVAGVFSSDPGIYMGMPGPEGDETPEPAKDVDGNPIEEIITPPTEGMTLGAMGGVFSRMKDTDHNGTIPLALAGQVPTKVCLENGPISKGDYITTSSFPGNGMRWEQVNLDAAEDMDQLKMLIQEKERRRGAVVGKALDPFDGTNTTHTNHLDQACGKIRILIAIQ